jgi:hypothetical protein
MVWRKRSKAERIAWWAGLSEDERTRYVARKTASPETKYWQELYRGYTDFLPYRNGYYRFLGEDDPADPAPFEIVES